jgi:type IV secretion system protein VirB2
LRLLPPAFAKWHSGISEKCLPNNTFVLPEAFGFVRQTLTHQPRSFHMLFHKMKLSSRRRGRTVRIAYPLAMLVLLPIAAHAQASPFDTGFTALETLFTGTVAKAASLIAIVVGGYAFAHGEPGAKRTLAGVAAGTGIAVLATNVLTWLWGV